MRDFVNERYQGTSTPCIFGLVYRLKIGPL